MSGKTSDGETRVSRTFALDPAGRVDAETLQSLLGLPGVLEADFQASRHRLKLVYDARRVDARAITGHLRRLGLRPDAGLWSRFRRALWAMQDENIRANTGHRAACCSRPPPGAGRH